MFNHLYYFRANSGKNLVMTILMDKMKEHSCAIQPAFGYGGGGLGLNFALMFDQVFNVEPIISPVVDDEPIEPPAPFLQQVDNLFNAANQQQPPQPPGIPSYSQLYAASGEEVQNATEGNQSVAELVANAVHQHIATHHAAFQGNGTISDSNNSNHPVINVAESIFNAIEESLSAAIPSTTHMIAIPVNGLLLPPPGPDPAEANAVELSNIPIPQQSSPLSYYLGIPFPSSPDLSFIDSLNDTHNSASSLPPDEESNSSHPEIQAPVSSPIHLPSSSNLSSAASSDDDDIVMILDSVEDEYNNEEN